MAEQNYYQLLGLSPDASAEEITAAVIAAEERWNPEVNPSPHARAFIAQIAKASFILTEPSRRALYDLALNPPGRENYAQAVGESIPDPVSTAPRVKRGISAPVVRQKRQPPEKPVQEQEKRNERSVQQEPELADLKPPAKIVQFGPVSASSVDQTGDRSAAASLSNDPQSDVEAETNAVQQSSETEQVAAQPDESDDLPATGGSGSVGQISDFAPVAADSQRVFDAVTKADEEENQVDTKAETSPEPVTFEVPDLAETGPSIETRPEVPAIEAQTADENTSGSEQALVNPTETQLDDDSSGPVSAPEDIDEESAKLEWIAGPIDASEDSEPASDTEPDPPEPARPMDWKQLLQQEAANALRGQTATTEDSSPEDSEATASITSEASLATGSLNESQADAPPGAANPALNGEATEQNNGSPSESFTTESQQPEVTLAADSSSPFAESASADDSLSESEPEQTASGKSVRDLMNDDDDPDAGLSWRDSLKGV